MPETGVSCPFCSGNESATPPDVLRSPADPSRPWRARIIPNRYPVTIDAAARRPSGDASGAIVAAAHGVHDVVIEAASHERSVLAVKPEAWRDVWQLCRQRLAMFADRGDLAWATIFKNSGPAAGASLVHLHSQIVAIDFVPPALEAKMLAAERTSFAAVLAAAKDAGRIVREQDGLLAFVPHAFRQPYETWIVPQAPAFAVLCDTKASPKVVRRVAEAAWELRPQFVLLGGDLVSTGTNKRHWTEHYFPNMEPLASRVVVYPVLGNHEQNASWYYDYMHLPAPEYFYSFRRGNVQFFMLDTNKDVSPGTEQYQWLDRELAASAATWKVCMHHQPPFSSDDDYGNDWKRPIRQATLGDRQAKPLVALYDKHAVDVVWSGHIHSYERTWTIRGGKPVTEGGTVYMITGGAGGHLETFGPYRPAFQNRIRRGHHFCYVTCLGGEFDIKAFDDEGRLFDHATLRKPSPDRPAAPPGR